MGALTDLFGGLLKPLLVALMVLIALGLFSQRPGEARSVSVGIECRSWTASAELNRLMCRYHPARLWSMPVADLIPGLGDG
jgi:hypothetical protein